MSRLRCLDSGAGLRSLMVQVGLHPLGLRLGFGPAKTALHLLDFRSPGAPLAP